MSQNVSEMMKKLDLESSLISIFPDFKDHWDMEDIYREENLSFSAHGLMRSFLNFYNENLESFTDVSLKKFGKLIEKEIAQDPKGITEVSNAILTEFFELIGEIECEKLSPYLTKTCAEHYTAWLNSD